MISSNGRRIVRFCVWAMGLYGILHCATPMCFANLLWPGQTLIKPWYDHVEITVNKKGNDFIAATVCDAELYIQFVEVDSSVEDFDVYPSEVVLQFPVPPNSENIKVTTNNDPVDIRKITPLPEEYEELFPGYDLLEWTLPPPEYGYSANIHVEYTHLLPQENGGWWLNYAFGSGSVNTSDYNVVYLRVILPFPLAASEVVSLNELQFDHQIEGERTIVSFGEAYDYKPLHNVSLLIKPENLSSAPLWELY